MIWGQSDSNYHSLSLWNSEYLAFECFWLTCEVAEDTDGEGEAGGVNRLQGRFRVT